jgi:4-hydroxy-4-methyl-2-oxoglutarate aldolase
MRLTTNILFTLPALIACAPSHAQVFTFTREQMIKYTANNPFERFEDGRPKAPDALIEKCKGLSAEEVWAVLPKEKFSNQYEGNWQILHPERKLVGRAVTAQFMPYRPDVDDVAEADAHARGLGRNANQRVIDMLQPGDVLVVDLMGKIEGGTVVGDNLATAIFAATKTGGLIVDGAIRDLEGIFPIEMAAYFRGVHPSAIDRGRAMLTAVNTPVRIGNATVMPGDVVFGDREGVYFIPPQLLKKVLDTADITHIHDEWTKMKIMTGKYKSSEIYPSPSDPALKKEYEEYLKKKLGK